MANGPRPVNWNTNNAPLSVLAEADLAGLPVQSFQTGTLCTSHNPADASSIPASWIWIQGDSASSSPGAVVSVSGVGAWIVVPTGAVAGSDINSVVGAAGTLSLQRTVPPQPVAVTVKGYYAPGDNGGGLFYWDPANVSADNGGTVIRPVGILVGAWVRIFTGALDVLMFGAHSDGVTDSRTAIVATISALPASGGCVQVSPGTYLWNGASIQVPSNVTLSGFGQASILKYTGTDKSAVASTDTIRATLKNLRIWATQSDCLRVESTADHQNQYTLCENVYFKMDGTNADAANAAVYCVGNTGAAGNGFVYWPSFLNCTWVGPNTAKSAAIRNAKTGNGVLFLTVREGVSEVFGRHFDFSLTVSARVDFVTFAGCVVTIPITAVDVAGNTLGAADALPFVTNDVFQVHSTGAVPGNIPADTNIYAINPVGSTVQASLTPGGAVIDILDAGTGAITFSKIGRYVYFGASCGESVVNYPHCELAGSADKIVEFADGSAECQFIDGTSAEYANVVGAKEPNVAGSLNSTNGFSQTVSTDSNIWRYPLTFPLLLQDSISEKTVGHGTTLGCANFKSTAATLTKPLGIDSGAAPTATQMLITANGLGALSLTNFSADNNWLDFDLKFTGSSNIAANATCARIYKFGGLLTIFRSSGNAVGGIAALTAISTWSLTTGFLRLGGATAGGNLLTLGTDADVTNVNLRVNGKTQATAGVGGIAIPTAAGFLNVNIKGTEYVIPYLPTA